MYNKKTHNTIIFSLSKLSTSAWKGFKEWQLLDSYLISKCFLQNYIYVHTPYIQYYKPCIYEYMYTHVSVAFFSNYNWICFSTIQEV